MSSNSTAKLVLVRPPYRPTVAARMLLETVQKIPGYKTLTLVSLGQSVQEFDMDLDGTIGATSAHHDDFMSAVDRGLETYAAIVIRQYIPLSVEMVVNAEGKRELRAWCALYGAVLREGRVECLTAEAIEHNCTHDLAGRPTDVETHVIYKDLADFSDDPLVFLN